MAKITKITHKCDCCGVESEHEDFNDGQECGNGKLNIYGNVGGCMYDGSWGGHNIKIEDEICFKCLQKLQMYYNEMKAMSPTA